MINFLPGHPVLFFLRKFLFRNTQMPGTSYAISQHVFYQVAKSGWEKLFPPALVAKHPVKRSGRPFHLVYYSLLLQIIPSVV
jgi:hypothetical protein